MLPPSVNFIANVFIDPSFDEFGLLWQTFLKVRSQAPLLINRLINFSQKLVQRAQFLPNRVSWTNFFENGFTDANFDEFELGADHFTFGGGGGLWFFPEKKFVSEFETKKNIFADYNGKKFFAVFRRKK